MDAVMRSLIIGVFALGSLACFVGCGSNSSDGDEPGGSGASGSGGTGTGGSADGGSNGSGASGSGGGDGSGGSGGESNTACSEIVTIETGRTPTTVLHVSTTGSPGGTGSEDAPFDTIESAAQAATPGTAIRIHSGTYAGDQFVSGLAGTADAPIWIGGAPGEAPPVIGTSANATGIQLSRARYVILHDLVVDGVTQNGLNIDDGGDYGNEDALRYLVLRDLTVRSVGNGGNQDCIKLSGANDYWVLDSELENCSLGGSGIDHVGCHDGLIAGNTFVGGGNGVQNKGGSRNIEIRGNTFRQNTGRVVNLGGSTGFEFFRPPLSTTEDNYEAADIRVVSNVFDHPDEALAFVGCVDCLAAQNTIYLPQTRILRILQETTTSGGFTFLPAQGGDLINNIIYYDSANIGSASAAINVGPNTSPETFHFENNLWYDVASPGTSEPVGAHPSAPIGSIAGLDPDFADASAGDFSITADSPAAAAGADVTVAGDFTGACFATPPAVGAFEVAE